MKHGRAIRYFMKIKYKVSGAELDLILFLSSEGRFSKSHFKSFNELLSWDKHRFQKLIDDKWIEIFRIYDKKTNSREVYQLSYAAKRLVTSYYDKLEGGLIAATRTHNPMFMSRARFASKVYRNFIKEMNKETLKLQRQHLEDLSQ